MNIYCSIFIFILFFLLTPGIIFRFPAKGSKITVGIVHGFLFSFIIYSLSYVFYKLFNAKIVEGNNANVSDQVKENYQKFFANVTDAIPMKVNAFYNFWEKLFDLYKNKYPNNKIIKQCIANTQSGLDRGAVYFRNIVCDEEVFRIEEIIMNRDTLSESKNGSNFDYIKEIKPELQYAIDKINEKMEIHGSGPLSNLDFNGRDKFLNSIFPELNMNATNNL